MNEEDLLFTSYRAPGQGVNQNGRGVRVVHKPTGLVSSSHDERTARQNREKALAALQVRLAEQLIPPEVPIMWASPEAPKPVTFDVIQKVVARSFKPRLAEVEDADADRVLEPDIRAYLETKTLGVLVKNKTLENLSAKLNAQNMDPVLVNWIELMASHNFDCVETEDLLTHLGVFPNSETP
jgi:hypothetical protein